MAEPWRRVAWAALLLIGVARLITGGLLPMQVVLALAAGVTGRACWWCSGCRTGGWGRPEWQRRSAQVACLSAR